MVGVCSEGRTHCSGQCIGCEGRDGGVGVTGRPDMLCYEVENIEGKEGFFGEERRKFCF